MTATIRLFAVARERAGAPEISVEVAEPATVGDLKGAIAEQYPALGPLLPAMLVAVDSEYAGDERPIRAGAELALIPPVSGG